ncbi:sugar transferase, PEP-CTERM system associated/exopolysaccharide biosynthesis polyprenyl glycosylphosphotransferase [Desulfocicer vacuolatum DSM 3385]|uniref:Sugar transferase, PEP-CTERM system associated/exopolysaccharide biosynthesis polyprenyl glycosylphosphotransferase n=1 Tax=Desulfocicer vacuolatum DSM 3385 TaxID=1121400 RepID=A0A1W1ZNJ5_9BACT|nr:TIGR03013 family XrtA/PEP-CTERM system glycosyltransferase [Desulfocicer vacuolatum]SMC49927.1 sugar transferase, PEP-CTERM system associated/exopolysaccharide biosynthesis polyprenyl glycosylphosphotransferase [Desulfocicer vacuolatum DSM 3385]
MLVDLTIVYVTFGIISPFLSSYQSSTLHPGSMEGNLVILTFMFITIIVLLTCNLYMATEFIYLSDLIKKTIPGFFLTLFFMETFFLFSNTFFLSNAHLILCLTFTFTTIFVFRCIVFYCLPYNREKILILGITSQASEIIKECLNKKIVGFEVMGFATSITSQVGQSIQDIPVLDTMDKLESILSKHTIDTIVVTLRNRRGKLPVHELLQCKFKNIRILEGTQFYETAQRKLLIDDFFKPSWFIFENGFYRTSLHLAFKRIQGLIISFSLLIFLSPILFITAVMIKIESSGPVFYFQERVGRNGKKFKLIKFRSMTVTAEKESGPIFALKHDTRITRIGHFIRKIRLDEIPQFINIFKGDMDLVGPRPERGVFVKELEKKLPYYHLRHAVRPGLTGWAQVNYPYGENFEDSKEKLNYDLYYVKHLSWHLDLHILLMTIREVLFGKGR